VTGKERISTTLERNRRKKRDKRDKESIVWTIRSDYLLLNMDLKVKFSNERRHILLFLRLNVYIHGAFQNKPKNLIAGSDDRICD